jgi:hypothetical protein
MASCLTKFDRKARRRGTWGVCVKCSSGGRFTVTTYVEVISNLLYGLRPVEGWVSTSNILRWVVINRKVIGCTTGIVAIARACKVAMDV